MHAIHLVLGPTGTRVRDNPAGAGDRFQPVIRTTDIRTGTVTDDGRVLWDGSNAPMIISEDGLLYIEPLLPDLAHRPDIWDEIECEPH